MRAHLVTIALAALPFLAGAQKTTEQSRLEIDSLFGVFQGYYAEALADSAWEILQVICAVASSELGAESAEYGRVRHNEALLLADRGRYAESEQAYYDALGIREKVFGADHSECAKTLNNLANLFITTGDLERAEPLLLRAREIWGVDPGKDSPYYAAVLLNLAVLYYELGNFTKAEPLYIEAKDLDARTVGKDHPYYAESLNNLANLYWRMRQFELAEPLYTEACSIRLAAHGDAHPQYAEALFNMANLQKALGRKSLAEAGYRQAASIWRQTLGESHPDFALALNSLALLLGETGQLEQADSLFRVSLRIRSSALGPEHLLYALSLSQLAEVCRLRGRHDEALALFEESAQRYRAIFARALRYLSERELTQYLEALNSITDLVLSYGADADAPAGLGGLCMDQALFYKGFALDAAMQIRRHAGSDPAFSERFEKLQGISRQLAGAYAVPPAARDLTLIADLENQSEAIEKEMARIRSAYGVVSTPVNWQSLRAALRPDEAVVEFARFGIDGSGDSPERMRYVAIILRADSPEPVVTPLCKESDLAALLRNPGRPKSEHIDDLYAGSGADALYRLVWQPLEAALGPARVVWLAPSGLLHQINLGALQPPGQALLGGRYHIRQVGSGRALCARAAERASGASGGRALVCGGLWYDLPAEQGAAAAQHSDWAYLRWTEVEAQSVRDILSDAGIHVTFLREGEGTEMRIKQFVAAGDTRILHLATHGFFFQRQNAANPAEGSGPFAQITHPMLRAGLLLSGANQFWRSGSLAANAVEDGVLTALEISRLNLIDVQLVVLSACETGLGDILGDEGVFGLQRAFKIAGAQRLLFSLWSVPDFHTQELMGLFYSLWLDDGKDIPEAFREAQYAMRLKYANPYYWAGFVLLE
ncbi:MAG: CHAT domain-containing tetratricopeptide repeat protein [Saprospiraceae bacterium]